MTKAASPKTKTRAEDQRPMKRRTAGFWLLIAIAVGVVGWLLGVNNAWGLGPAFFKVTPFAVGTVGVIATIAAQPKRRYVVLGCRIIAFLALGAVAVWPEPGVIIAAAVVAAFASAIPPLSQR